MIQMTNALRRMFFILVAVCFSRATAEDADFSSNYNNDDADITYWTDYAILPKRCIVYNDVDMIVFSVYGNRYKQCSDDPMGTYIAEVPYFLEGYLAEKAQEMQDSGYDDYAEPDSAQYIYCTPYVIQNVQYYMQIGCADDTSQALAINIYEDDACTVRSMVDGYDDSNIDVSDIQIPFKKCEACVNWVDMADDKIDDGFYEKRQTEAPLCGTAWTYKQTCNRKCQRAGLEARLGWNTSDKFLLGILSVFGLTMLGLILRKRQFMSPKDSLLEEAAMSAAGLQKPHLIGIFILVVLVLAVFASLGLKNITWALLLIINISLFAYLMKLTVDSVVNTGETIIGPDGNIIQRDMDDDDSSDDESPHKTPRNTAGTYMLPTLS